MTLATESRVESLPDLPRQPPPSPRAGGAAVILLGLLAAAIWSTIALRINTATLSPRLATSPYSAVRRYFVIHQTCRGISTGLADLKFENLLEAGGAWRDDD